MKAITLRQIPPDLATFIEDEAAKTHSSLNATVIRLLRRAADLEAPKPQAGKQKYRDLDFLIGSWTKEEADDFDRYLEESRAQDMELQRLEWAREDKLK